jgi:F0F1-type ATP synthase assembly protein I
MTRLAGAITKKIMVPPQNSSTIWRHVYAGTSLALTILVYTFAGIWIDRFWAIKPWGTMAGAFIGIAVGLYNFIREFSNT